MYVPVTEGEFIQTMADGTTAEFQPLQFHFHAPAEHTIDGQEFDLEMHLVHTYKEEGSDKLLGGVIGFIFDRKEGGNYENPFITDLWQEGKVVHIPLASFLSRVNMKDYWNYDGSLTTPPCTEGIKWTMVRQI